MDQPTAIRVESVSKNFKLPHEKAGTVKSIITGFYNKNVSGAEVQHALKNISFEIKQGEFFGIVGRNGSGKSTMLKILAGIYQPTSGTVTTHGKLVPFIELGVGFNPELTGRENVYLNGAMLGFDTKQIDSMYQDIVAFAELERFMDQKLKNYSSGMQVRLAFSMATRSDAEILLVDEVLAVGDADFQKKCFKYFRNLKKLKKTVVFVSHDMNAVEEYCDRAVLIEKNELIVAGTSAEVARAYTRMFLDDSMIVDNVVNKSKRWGAGNIKAESVSVNPLVIHGDKPKIELNVKVTASDTVRNPIVGFKIRGDDGSSILGTNTKLKGHKIDKLAKAASVNTKWQIPNLFNTGSYYVDIAITSHDYEQVYDSWEEAAQFTVQRNEDNSYSIHPIIDLTVT